jgi:type I restriction enzyme S subunit
MTKAPLPSRPSGLRWIDTIPANWEERALGTEASVRARLGWKGLTANEYVSSGVPMIATPNIKGSEIDFDSGVRITQERYEESPEIMLAVGDVLLTKDGATIGIVNMVRDLPEPATVNGSIAVISPNQGLHGPFLYWFLASSYAQSLFQLLMGGMGVPHLFQRDINRIRMPYPPLVIQRRIADYLDREVSQIDAMLGKIDKLTATLSDRRTSAIQRATQFSLDGTRWDTTPTAHLFRSIGSGTTPKEQRHYTEDVDGVPWVTTSELRENVITETSRRVTRRAISDVSSLKIHPAGAVLIAMYGATIGRLATLGVDAATNQACCAFSDPRGVDVRFFYYTLWGQRDDIILLAVGGGQPNISQTMLRRWRVPCPPLDEQIRIADELDEATARVDVMLAKVGELKSILLERRAALITDVVTGKKDVT